MFEYIYESTTAVSIGIGRPVWVSQTGFSVPLG